MKNNMKMVLTIDQFEGEKAFLKTAENEMIIWPKKKLPADYKEGATLYFKISENNKDDSSPNAKEVLNELLKTEE